MLITKGLFWFIILYCAFSLNFATDHCPDKCHCIRRTVRCVHVGLSTIPAVPADTQTLDLRFNDIRDIPPGFFKPFRYLSTLLLNNNRLSKIHRGAFEGLRWLRFLSLYKNRIHHIDGGAFSGLDRLEHLYLHVNDLTNIGYDVFNNLPRLEKLFLHVNKIKHIPYGSFNGSPRLRRLRLDSNALRCDCSLAWLPKMFRERHLHAVATCHSPREMTGASLPAMTAEDMHCVIPSIIKEPQDVLVNFGGEATFTCEVSGQPTPQIVWMKDSVKLNLEDNRYTILPNGTLKIKNSHEKDIGIFECVASNSVGRVKSRPVRMLMEKDTHAEYPIFTSRPQDLNVRLGEKSVVINCAAKGVPKPHIRWYHNDQRLMRSASTDLHYNGSLLFHTILEHNQGLYTCQAENVHGKITASAELKIVSKPTFTEIPSIKAAQIADNVEFTCIAKGNPPPTIVWYKDSHPLSTTARIRLQENSTSLKILSIKHTDQGVYYCRAENTEGFIETKTTLKIVHKLDNEAKLVQKPFDMEAALGSSIEFPCRGEGNPEPRISWKKDGSAIRKSQKYKIATFGSLFIRNVSYNDAGRYECTASNIHGSDSTSGYLTVRNSVLPGDKFIKIAFKEATDEIDTAIAKTVDQLFGSDKSTFNAGDLFRVVRFPDAPTREIAKAAEIYERTLVNVRKHVNSGRHVTASPNFSYKDILSPKHLELIENLSGCTAHRRTSDCSDMCFHSKYRNIDGSCNNWDNVMWGASLTGFRRILPPIYEDGFSQPVGWNSGKKYNGFVLPSARLVSTEIISTEIITPDTQITHMVMQWGQFLDHDLDHSLPSVSSQSWDGIDCKKSCELAAPCFPIYVPTNDPRISNRRCIDVVRTSSVCGSGMTSVLFGEIQPREQINQLTSFIDASQVYGFSEELAKELRNLTSDHGLLRIGPIFPERKALLPYAGNQGMDCRRNLLESNVNCFLAGDIRVNEQVGLTAMHTIWMREHNNIANVLRELNPFWDGDTIYQEARKVVGAVMQHITYNHWLPIIIGPSGIKALGEYTGYDYNVDPSISNVFATAALRFGHTIINPVLHRLDEKFETIAQGDLDLHNAFFAPWRIVDEGGIDPLIRGLFVSPAKLKRPGENLNRELTEKLFHTAHAVALDLAAINIQRSRDHAIPPYTKWREFCNMSAVNTFDDLADEIIDAEVRQKLKKIYGSPHNIDVWVGGILEEQVNGGKVGPLFQCLLVEQFKRLRSGDNFWYEKENVFSKSQLRQIKKTSLARVLCDNADNINIISENVFLLPELQDGMVDCEDLPSIEYRYWTDCNECADSDFQTQKRTKRNVNLEANNDSNKINEMEKIITNFTTIIKSMQQEIHDLQKQCSAFTDNY